MSPNLGSNVATQAHMSQGSSVAGINCRLTSLKGTMQTNNQCMNLESKKILPSAHVVFEIMVCCLFIVLLSILDYRLVPQCYDYFLTQHFSVILQVVLYNVLRAESRFSGRYQNTKYLLVQCICLEFNILKHEMPITVMPDVDT